MNAPSNILHVTTSDADTTTVLNTLRLERLTSGTAAAGLGTAIDFYLEDAAGNSNQAARIDAAWEVATNGSEEASLRFNVMDGGSLGEAMRIDDNKNVGIGTTAPAILNSAGYTYLTVSNATGSIIELQRATATTSADIGIIDFWNGSTRVAEIGALGDGATDSGKLAFWTTPTGGSVTERMRIDSVGNVIVGSGGSAGTSCAKCLALASSTAPSASITDGIQLFAVDIAGSHELRVRDEAGNVTTLSPHNFSLFQPDQDYYLPWSYTSEKGTEAINVDMYGAIQQIELLSGKHFIYGKNLKSGETFTPTNLAEILSVPEAFEETNVRFAAIEERVTTLETTLASDEATPPSQGGENHDDTVVAPPYEGGVDSAESGVVTEDIITALNSSDLDLKSIIIRADATIYGTLVTDTLEVATALNLHGDATIWGSLLVKGDVELEANARVAGSLTRGNEETGHATIPAGSAWAAVRFTETLAAVPHVSITLVGGTAPYILSDVSRQGFTLTLLENPGADTSFTWVAVTADKKSPEVETGGSFDAADESSVEQESVEPPPPVVDTPETAPPEVTPVPPLPVESSTPAEAPPAAPL